MQSIDEKYRDEDGCVYAVYHEVNHERERMENRKIWIALFMILAIFLLIWLVCVWILPSVFSLAAWLGRLLSFLMLFWLLRSMIIWIMSLR